MIEANPLTKSDLRRPPKIPAPLPEAPAHRSEVGVRVPIAIPGRSVQRAILGSHLPPPEQPPICGHHSRRKRAPTRIRQEFLPFPIAQWRTPRPQSRRPLHHRNCREPPFVSSDLGGRGKSSVPSANSITWPALANQIRSVASVVFACWYSALESSVDFSPISFAKAFSANCFLEIFGYDLIVERMTDKPFEMDP